MRIPSFQTVFRTVLTFSHASRVFSANINPLTQYQSLLSSASSRTTVLKKSMPLVPFIGGLFGSSSSSSKSDAMEEFPVQKSKDEWQAVLSKEQFRVLREQGTEAPFTGKFDKHMPSSGVYTCAGCSAPLYRATHKFKSGCGWPAYFDSIPGAVKRRTDSTFGMARTEILCANCGGHLGHVFKGEGYHNPTDERHCVNSVSLNFAKEEEGPEKGVVEEGKKD